MSHDHGIGKSLTGGEMQEPRRTLWCIVNSIIGLSAIRSSVWISFLRESQLIRSSEAAAHAFAACGYA